MHLGMLHALLKFMWPMSSQDPGGSLLRTAASWKSVNNLHLSVALKSLNM